MNPREPAADTQRRGAHDAAVAASLRGIFGICLPIPDVRWPLSRALNGRVTPRAGGAERSLRRERADGLRRQDPAQIWVSASLRRGAGDSIPRFPS
ncbi:hypothetical protein LBMAG42_38670 [Deltaproteobacteria bacterium]|nr:hypothetical protein LBMAG42_38670 [Deltaproteobacteria bacterium]